MRERCPYARPPRHITVAPKKGKLPIHFNPDNRKTISQLLTAKWDPSCQDANVLICNATATHVLIENGWHYLDCHRCSKKVMGDDGDLWCTKCDAKVQMPIARFMVRFEVEDHTGTTVFVALDSEVQKMVRSTAAELIGASEWDLCCTKCKICGNIWILADTPASC
ncbi:replication protein A 70 kDa DNA-binding subunit C-like isoform X2 [Papaver somniferum]|uniref:replication protein A 70 kDa DNA-binding subunit C-like isoform X2 n=1 Tax=Papaver somniferum TaxID=3469 RepID=UPI000E7032A3|nr:replication protein A 70 kDa DNA-binding subunit C-like isoform X2 [Papaver somniferum]